MPLPEFSFIKLLTDVLAFPKPWNRTVFQKLHDETQAYLNGTVKPAIDKLERVSVDSAFMAKPTVVQTLPAGVATLINYDSETYDHNNEYDPATSTFTAKQAGLYSLKMALGWVGNARCFVDVYVNNVQTYRISDEQTTTVSTAIGGLDFMLAANDKVTLKLTPSIQVTTDWLPLDYFTITKIG